MRDPNRPNFFSKSDLCKSFQTDSDTQMNLFSSALIFYLGCHFPRGHMSMDLSSVLTTPSSHGVPSVTGTCIQVASPQGCTPGLAGPEPSGTFIHPGQHLHGTRGYMYIVPAGPTTLLGTLGTQMEIVGTLEATISFLCAAQPKRYKDSPAAVPSVPGQPHAAVKEANNLEIPVEISRQMAGINHSL